MPCRSQLCCLWVDVLEKMLQSFRQHQWTWRVALLAISAQANTPDGIFDIGNLLQSGSRQEGSSPDGPAGCQSRRGVAQCVSIGDDCERTQMPEGCEPGSCTRSKIAFPMRRVTVEFPCAPDDGFRSKPMVQAYIKGQENSKMYTTSIVHATATGFSANVQRTDDVDEPDLTCSAIELCYMAMALTVGPVL